MALGMLRHLEVMNVFRGPSVLWAEAVLLWTGLQHLRIWHLQDLYLLIYLHLSACSSCSPDLNSPLDRNTVVVSAPRSGFILISRVLTSRWHGLAPVLRQRKRTQSIVMRFLLLLQCAFRFLHGYRVLQLICQEPTWTVTLDCHC